MVSGPAILSQHQQEDHAWEPEQYECATDAANEIEDGSDVLDEECSKDHNQVSSQAEVEVGRLVYV